MFKFLCQHCSNVLEHEEDLVGEHVQCDECEGIFVVDQVEPDTEAELPTLSEAEADEVLSEVEEAETEAALPMDLPSPTSTDFAPQSADVATDSDGLPAAPAKQSVAKWIRIGSGLLLGLCAAIGFYLTVGQSQEPSTVEGLQSSQMPESSAVEASTASPTNTRASAESTASASSRTVVKAKPSDAKRQKAIATAPKSRTQESVDAQGQEFVLQGLITGRSHETKKRMIYELSYGFEGKKVRTSGAGGKNARNIDYSQYVGKYVTLTGTGQNTDKGLSLDKIISIEPLLGSELDAYLNALNLATTRVFDDSPNGLPFAGTWGARLSLPTGKEPDVVDDFKVSDFAKQFSKLKSASYVLVNVTQPSGPCYFSAPNPELSKISSTLNASMPKRDLLGEVLDAIAKDGKKAFVYYACEGFHKGDDTRPQKEKDMRLVWDQYVESMGVSNNELLGKLVVGYYAKRYGSKINGWWFDGAGVLDKEDRLLWRKLVSEGNPEAIVAFNRMAGPPFCSTPECDVFGGHPTPRAREHFWSMVNLPMIETIEAGAWMDPEGKPVDEPGMGALGHVFMGMQDRWNSGKCEFPPEQAIEWTQRVLKAGGMYTWHGPRSESGWAKDQFELLLKIDAAVTKMRQQN